MAARTQVRRRESQSPPSRARSADRERTSQDSPLIAPEDLAELGVEQQLIPFVISTASQVDQLPDGATSLSSTDAENLVEILDKVVSSATTNPSLKSRCLRIIRKAASEHCVLPESYFLPGVALSDNIPYASGVFADVWKGQQDADQVSIKAFRIQTVTNQDKIRRRFYREIVGWKDVSHRNILPFLGVSDMLSSFCIITPWLPNGNIIKYIRARDGANRLQLLAQAACGLGHLHSLGIVHSNVHPGNILITDEGNACVGDFGITAIITDPTVVERSNMTTSKSGVTRYMAPELLNPPQFGLTHSDPSKDSDVYSFAMTVYEVLSGTSPYSGREEGPMALSIVTGSRPPRPNDSAANDWINDRLWDAIKRCWIEAPRSRPPIHSLHKELAKQGQGEKNLQVTKNDTTTVHIIDTVVSSPEQTQSEGKNSAQSVQPSAALPDKRSKSVQPRLVERNQSENTQLQPKSEAVRQGVKPEVVQQGTPPNAGARKSWKKLFCGLF